MALRILIAEDFRAFCTASVFKKSHTFRSMEKPAFARVEGLAREGVIEKVLVHEVSRLARKNSIAHSFVEMLEDVGVSLYWHQQGIETLLPNGKRNPAAAIMFALLAEMARSELELLSDRIKSGLEEAKRRGQKLGRPKGSKVARSEFLAKHRDICRRLKEGHSVRNTAKITGKGASTVQRVKKEMERVAA